MSIAEKKFKAHVDNETISVDEAYESLTRRHDKIMRAQFSDILWQVNHGCALFSSGENANFFNIKVVTTQGVQIQRVENGFGTDEELTSTTYECDGACDVTGNASSASFIVPLVESREDVKKVWSELRSTLKQQQKDHRTMNIQNPGGVAHALAKVVKERGPKDADSEQSSPTSKKQEPAMPDFALLGYLKSSKYFATPSIVIDGWLLFVAVMKEGYGLCHRQFQHIADALLVTFLITIIDEDVTALFNQLDSDSVVRARTQQLPLRLRALIYCSDVVATHSNPMINNPNCVKKLSEIQQKILNTDRKAIDLAQNYSKVGAYLQSAIDEIHNAHETGSLRGFALADNSLRQQQPVQTKIDDGIRLLLPLPLPTSFEKKPDPATWNEAGLSCHHIELLVRQELQRFRPACGHQLPKHLFDWWKLYKTRAVRTTQQVEDTWIDFFQNRSRRIVTSVMFWFLMEESMRKNLPKTCEHFTTIPVAIILVYLKKFVLDSTPDMHDAVELLKRLLLQKSELSFAWRNQKTIAEFGCVLADEECMNPVVDSYRKMKDALESRAKTLFEETVSTLRGEMHAASDYPCPGLGTQSQCCDPHCVRCSTLRKLQERSFDATLVPCANEGTACLASNRCPELIEVNEIMINVTSSIFELTPCDGQCDGQCVLVRDLPALPDFMKFDDFENPLLLHIHCSHPKKSLKLENVTTWDDLLVYPPAVEYVGPWPREGEATCRLPQKPKFKRSVTHIDGTLPTELQWMLQHPSSSNPTRGNLPYIKASRDFLSSTGHSSFQSKIPVLGIVRTAAEMQHRLALQVLLDGDIDGHMIGHGPVWIGQTLFLAGSHSAGRLNDDHRSYLNAQQESTKDFIVEITPRNSCALVLIAQQYAAALHDDRVENALSILKSIVSKASTLLDESLASPFDETNESERWNAAHRAAVVVLAVCSFLPSHGANSDSMYLAVAFVKANVVSFAASLFVDVTQCVQSKRLRMFANQARNNAAFWEVLKESHTEVASQCFAGGNLHSLSIFHEMEKEMVWVPIHETHMFLKANAPLGNWYLLNMYTGEISGNRCSFGVPDTVRALREYKALFKERNYCCKHEWEWLHHIAQGPKESSLAINFICSKDHGVEMEAKSDNRKVRYRLHFGELDGNNEPSLATIIRGKRYFGWIDHDRADSYILFFPAPTGKESIQVPLTASYLGYVREGFVVYHEISQKTWLESSTDLFLGQYRVPSSAPGIVSTTEVLKNLFSHLKTGVTVILGDTVKIELDALGTSFIASSDSIVWSDDPSYRIALNDRVPWLPCNSKYLVLSLILPRATRENLMKPCELVLLPVTKVDCDGSSRSKFLVKAYVHDHFQSIECDSLAGRLRIASILCRCDSGIVAWGKSIASIEQVMVILRRCISNRPLTATEQHQIKVLKRNNTNPAVFLLCAAIERASCQGSNLIYHQRSDFVCFLEPLSLGRAFSQYCVRLQQCCIPPCCILTNEELELACFMPPPIPPTPFILERKKDDFQQSIDDEISDFTKSMTTVFSKLEVAFTQAIEIQGIPNDSKVAADEEDAAAKFKTHFELCKRHYKSDSHVPQKEFRPTELDGYLADGQTLQRTAESIKDKMLDMIHSFNHFNQFDAQQSLTSVTGVPLNSDLWKIANRVGHVSQLHAGRFAAASKDELDQLAPHLSKDTLRSLQTVCIQYVQLCGDIDSLARVVHYLSELCGYHQTTNSFTTIQSDILREVTSPRNEIAEFPAWQVFEAEQRIRIRKVQYQTFTLLTASPTSCVTQLNTGEGKTRVIIPMIILRNIKCHVCVYALSSVVGECTEALSRSLSTPGLRMHQLSFPFDRTVDVESAQCGRSVVNVLRSLERRFIVVTRESATSLILKQEELEHRMPQCTQLPTMSTICDVDDTLHVFDEVDELLDSKYSMVYSVGDPEGVPLIDTRAEMMQHLLMSVAHERHRLHHVVSLEPRESADHSAFPRVYLTHEILREEDKRIIASHFIANPPSCCLWMRERRDQLLDQVLGDTPPDNIEVDAREQMCFLRGMFHHDVLGFILSRHPQEQYGVPPSTRTSRLAVPYDAADVPSLRCEFSQPDVCFGLTFLSYFHRGLTKAQFKEALVALVAAPMALREHEVKTWQPSSRSLDDTATIPIHGEVDIADEKLVSELYRQYRRSIGTIGFWLRDCVFTKECQHLPQVLIASAWDIANVGKVIGFSGTSDNRWILPKPIKYLPQNESSAFRDVDRVRQIKAVTQIELSDENLALAVVNCAFVEGCSVIIDVGGLLAESPLESFAEYILRKDLLPENLKGICYFNSFSGSWTVLHKQTRYTTKLQFSSVGAHDCFVIYDQARCRGADLQLDPTAIAMITLNESTTKDAFMQGVGRLRLFGMTQTINVAAPSHVADLLFSNVGDETAGERLIKMLLSNTEKSLSLGEKLLQSGQLLFDTKKRNPKQLTAVPSLPSALYTDESSVRSSSHQSVEHQSIVKQSIHVQQRINDDNRTQQTPNSEVEVDELYNTIVSLTDRMRRNKKVAFNGVCELVKHSIPQVDAVWNVPNILRASTNFFKTSIAETGPLRKVHTLLVIEDCSDQREKFAFWLTELEIATFQSHWMKEARIHTYHLRPGREGGLTVLSNLSINDSQTRNVIAFTMLFNGRSMFGTKDGWYDIVKGLLISNCSSSNFRLAACYFISQRDAQASFPKSDLEAILQPAETTTTPSRKRNREDEELSWNREDDELSY
ncbi:Hypothetical protein, putative [Bodo saltans]|uniref:ubiquitinyl hydrolase 1 n=1 Tax=Bodo saltans TaxID=75058 RepID=A0A0S4JK87_BODSA|nr:Hypothetical protein, putative [Bodo saltans]|eukprot:CUG90579.1 Hypothetical protein, putative [Bodo saltans]